MFRFTCVHSGSPDTYIRRVLLFLALSSTIAVAQVDRATLTGSISDSSGAVVPGALVEIVSVDTGLRRSVEASGNGSYTASQLPIGVYTVTVNHPGFRPVSVKDVRLGVGDNRSLNIQMEVSTVD